MWLFSLQLPLIPPPKQKFITYGNIKINSISKIKKINPTIKKWIEKGERLSSYPKNPHSKGIIFSKSFSLLTDKKIIKKNIITLNPITNKIIKK